MREKKTLFQIRSTHRFNIPQLCQAAEVGPEVAYNAMIAHPIKKDDAIKILRGLSKLTNTEWTLESVDIPLYEDQMILYMVLLSGERNTLSVQPQNRIQFVYAQDKKHALLLTQPWIEQNNHLPYVTCMSFEVGIVVDGIDVPGYRRAQ